MFIKEVKFTIAGISKNSLSLAFLSLALFALGATRLYAVPDVVNMFMGDIIGELEGQTFDVQITYNDEVNTSSIDVNDIIIEGTSGNNLGKILKINDVFLVNLPNGTLGAYSFGPVSAFGNGDYIVKLAENEVFGFGEPTVAVTARDLGNFTQEVSPSTDIIIQGRVFVETGEPSLDDDGSLTDPGLSIDTILQKASSGGQWLTTLFSDYSGNFGAASRGRFMFTVDSPGNYRLVTQVQNNTTGFAMVKSHGQNGLFNQSAIQHAKESWTMKCTLR